MKLELIFELAFAVIGLTSAQHISDKPCPLDRPIQQNFDVEKYTSVNWFELMRYDILNEKGFDCGIAKYTLKEDKYSSFSYCHKKLPDTKEICLDGKSYVSFPDATPLEGKFNVSIGTNHHENCNYWVISTDYEHYSIVNFCHNIDDGKSSDVFWVLSPQRLLNSNAQIIVDDIIEKHFVKDQIIFVEQNSSKCGEQ